jgi:lipopolysaccharide/colanic/teichoic acid biosynthesis glycosyltransferase
LGKRLFDAVIGTGLALLSLPLMLVLAVGVCITLRTWRPFFVQARIGWRGRRIRILKLRTLPPDFPRYALKTALAGVSLPRYSMFLRRTHLDELPQLLQVPFGRLSLVGPRPKMPDQYEPVDEAYRTMRIAVPQGCTGLWQIGRHAPEPPDKAPEYDEFYLQNASLRLDLWISWRTLLLVLRLAPQVDLRDVPQWARRMTEAPVPAVPQPLMEGATTE